MLLKKFKYHLALILNEMPKKSEKNNLMHLVLPRRYHRRTFGQKLADGLAEKAGSWAFIIGFFVFLLFWMAVNTYMVLTHVWDPYPFILLNLVLSCLAAIQAPIILMSQNRAAEVDRQKAERDYYVNRKAEKEIKILQRDVLQVKAILSKQPSLDEIGNLEKEIRKIQKEIDVLLSGNTKKP
ncbi:MAG: DUF1003 domain-containing protein [Candidatus Diapherotrites archaeon]|uniref:DUF1003 domain-containing protein n=1 Tax=Candidatus Iainarchaeum sp. TaxID=3101447 RepID=A0A938YXG9_9ARCH|nr:DUF1003 domain-containing protein [Candidatus Diapherotrites archaeon]